MGDILGRHRKDRASGCHCRTQLSVPRIPDLASQMIISIADIIQGKSFKKRGPECHHIAMVLLLRHHTGTSRRANLPCRLVTLIWQWPFYVRGYTDWEPKSSVISTFVFPKGSQKICNITMFDCTDCFSI